MNFKKNISSAKFRPVFLNIIRSILTPLLTLMISYIIVNFFSKELWGEFVKVQLYYFITLIIADWGAKTYLQKRFSNDPSQIIISWQKQFLVRVPAALICLLVILFFVNHINARFLSLWFLSSFIYNSFLAILFYNRDYLLIITAELSSFLVLVLLFVFSKETLNLDKLIIFYSIYTLFKAIIPSIKYYKFLKFKSFKINFNELKLGLPFLLIGITGFLHSKIDVYTYTLFTDSLRLGEYQIISAFFIFSQSIVTILLFPYIKNIYRMNFTSLKKLRNRLMYLGVFINLFITVLIFVILEKYFLINLSFFEYLTGFFISFPSYIYSIKVFELFKLNQEKKVLVISIIGLLLNLILSITLLTINSSVLSVLLANSITQIFTMMIYLKIASPFKFQKSYN